MVRAELLDAGATIRVSRTQILQELSPAIWTAKVRTMNDQLTPVPTEEAGRILLVDDDATNLDVLRETLAGPNYRLFVARSGEEALKVARRAKPSIVLLDVVMPGIDGYETCRRLKEDPDTRDAAVIFLSALNDPKDKVRGFEAGAVDFISKPVAGGGGDRARQYASHDPAPAPSPGRGRVRPAAPQRRAR